MRKQILYKDRQENLTNIYVMQNLDVIYWKNKWSSCPKKEYILFAFGTLKAKMQCIIQNIQQILLILLLSLDTISCAGND